MSEVVFSTALMCLGSYQVTPC